MRIVLLFSLAVLGNACSASRSASWGAPSPEAAAHRSMDDFGVSGTPPPGLFVANSTYDFRAQGGEDAANQAMDPAASSNADPTANPAADRLLIHTGSLQIAVADLEAAGRQARAMTESLGGYVHLLTNDEVILRIPTDQFATALEKATQLGRILGRELRVQDVTEEFQDVELELKNARALSERLVELLAQAENVEAALKVEKELARVRTQIERLEGRRKYLSNQIAFATLHLGFHQVSEVAPQGSRLPFDWLQRLGLERLLGIQGVSR